MASIHKLPDDIIKDILDYLESDSQRSVPVDRREHLSVESFRPPSPPSPSQAQDLGNFRLVCQKFSNLAIPYQFSRVSLRFSPSGFNRLDAICNHDHLARHTRKFSYLVPPFYGISRHEADRSYTDAFRQRVLEQRRLLQSKEDARILKRAMHAFTTLQHVQILRLIEPPEMEMPRSFVDLSWSPACSHATRTVGEALIHGRSPFCRFSGPMMHPQSATIARENIPQTLILLAARLTCLELHFDGGPELLEKMLELSDLARMVFQATKNLQALHVGFPSRTPLDLRLEAMFHHTRWDKLRAFGLQAWRLESEEIIKLVRSHRKTLKGLRLRDVQLKQGSHWQDVLKFLRAEMNLDWVSLRRIDYADHFDAVWEGSMEVPDEPLTSASDSDEEDEILIQHSDGESEEASDQGDSDEDSNSDTDHGPDADEFALRSNTSTSQPFCTCSCGSDTSDLDDLGDNGLFVTYQQRKMWERWVCGRCPEHSQT